MRTSSSVVALLLAVAHPAGAQGESESEEPALPAGLVSDAVEPEVLLVLPWKRIEIPGGLTSGPDKPAEPGGPGGPDVVAATPSSSSIPLEFRAIIDLRAGARVVGDPLERSLSISEVRAELDLTKSWRPWSTVAKVVVDAVGDPLADRQAPELETGEGAVDLRIAALTASPTGWLDVRVGRQVLTWGTGDLVFINDLFPKDWMAFLVGRHDDYLKAPSDAIKLAAFTSDLGLDVVLSPRFDADRLPVRDRLSSWDPALGRLAGEDDPVMLDRPDEWIKDGEVALRIFRNLGSWELAGYGYRGFWKSPAGINPTSGAAVFPELSVYGASMRGPALGGLFHAEGGYYDSRSDRAGSDPMTRNGEVRVVFGHERQLADNLTIGAQYYLEAMLDHDAYVAGLPPGLLASDRLRHVVTTRLMYMALAQRLMLTAFVFVSPSDRDGYLRATASYAVDDHWIVLAGGNLLAGKDDHTFFGQLENNSNAYAGIRYAY